MMWGKKYGKAIAPDVGRVKISILKVARDSRQIPSVRSYVTGIATRWLAWIPRESMAKMRLVSEGCCIPPFFTD